MTDTERSHRQRGCRRNPMTFAGRRPAMGARGGVILVDELIAERRREVERESEMFSQ